MAVNSVIAMPMVQCIVRSRLCIQQQAGHAAVSLMFKVIYTEYARMAMMSSMLII